MDLERTMQTLAEAWAAASKSAHYFPNHGRDEETTQSKFAKQDMEQTRPCSSHILGGVASNTRYTDYTANLRSPHPSCSKEGDEEVDDDQEQAQKAEFGSGTRDLGKSPKSFNHTDEESAAPDQARPNQVSFHNNKDLPRMFSIKSSNPAVKLHRPFEIPATLDREDQQHPSHCSRGSKGNPNERQHHLLDLPYFIGPGPKEKYGRDELEKPPKISMRVRCTLEHSVPMATKDPSLTVPTHLEQKEDVESEAMKAVKEKLVNGTESMTSNALGPFDIGVEVPSDLEFPRLLPTILEQLKIIPDMDDIIEMQAEVLVPFWSPLSLSQIHVDKREDLIDLNGNTSPGGSGTVGQIFGQLIKSPVLRIKIRIKCSVSKEMRDRVMTLLVEQYYRDLRKRTDAMFPFGRSLERSVIPLDASSPDKTHDHHPKLEDKMFHLPPSPLRDSKNNHFGPDLVPNYKAEMDQKILSKWSDHFHTSKFHRARSLFGSNFLDPVRTSLEDLPSTSTMSTEHKSSVPNSAYLVQKPRMRVCFDPETEIPRLQKWFTDNNHPSRQQVEEYVKELNSLDSRRGRKSLDVNNVIYWFKNTRAAVKRAEMKSRQFNDVGFTGGSTSSWPWTSELRSFSSILNTEIGRPGSANKGEETRGNQGTSSDIESPRDDDKSEERKSPDEVSVLWPSKRDLKVRSDLGEESTNSLDESRRNRQSPFERLPMKEGTGIPSLSFPPSLLYSGSSLTNNPLFSPGMLYMSQYMNPFLHGSGSSPTSPTSMFGMDPEKRKRNRTFIDPVSEVPRLEEWFQLNTHPSHALISRYTEELNRLPYRQKFPKLEQKNIQFWFKNRRAKCKRMNNL